MVNLLTVKAFVGKFHTEVREIKKTVVMTVMMTMILMEVFEREVKPTESDYTYRVKSSSQERGSRKEDIVRIQ